MSNGVRLELSSLPKRHPKCGLALQISYGAAAVIRLCFDPVMLAKDAEDREVVFGHAAVGARATVEHRHSVYWGQQADRAFLEQLSITMPPDTLTESAAVALAALSVSEFEQGRISHVLPKGSGGDYHVEVDWRQHPVQLEVSGLRRDDSPTGAGTNARVDEKCGQVLTKVREGFVSVTAFHHQPNGQPYSLLCYVTRDTIARG